MKYIIVSLLIAACGTEEKKPEWVDNEAKTICKVEENSIIDMIESQDYSKLDVFLADDDYYVCKESDEGLLYAICDYDNNGVISVDWLPGDSVSDGSKCETIGDSNE